MGNTFIGFLLGIIATYVAPFCVSRIMQWYYRKQVTRLYEKHVTELKPVPVQNEWLTPQPPSEHQLFAMQHVQGLKIFRHFTISPDDLVTRLNFVVTFVTLLRRQGVAEALSSYVPQFDDAAEIPAWAWGYVNVAKSLGYVPQVWASTFDPNLPITHGEVLSACLTVLGYQVDSDPGKNVLRATDLGLTEGLDVVAGLPIVMSEYWTILWHTLTQPRYPGARFTFLEAVWHHRYEKISSISTDRMVDYLAVVKREPYVIGEKHYVVEKMPGNAQGMTELANKKSAGGWVLMSTFQTEDNRVFAVFKKRSWPQ